MSNNTYYAFSTAPGTHSSGPPMPGMHGQPNSVHHNPGPGNANAGMHDGMLPLLGANTSGDMVAYPVPSSQQQQQQHQPVHTSRFNLGPGMGSAPFHGAALPASPAGAVNTGGGALGGPAVPAPRSTATLIAEVTGAPPPPPARSRSSLSGTSLSSVPAAGMTAASGTAGMPTGVAGHGGTMSAPGGIHMATPPAPTTASSITTGTKTPRMLPAGGAVAAPRTPTGSDPATATTSLVSTSFKAFTTSAATMLSTLGNAGASRDGAGAAATEGSASSAGAARSCADRGVGELSPFSRVEVRLTQENCDPPASDFAAAAAVEDGAATWDPTVETAFEVDPTSLFLATFTIGDHEEEAFSHLEEADQGDRERLDLIDLLNPPKSAALIGARLDDCLKRRVEIQSTLFNLTLAIVAGEGYELVPLLPVRHAMPLRYSLVYHLLTRLLDARRSLSTASPYIKGLAAMLDCGSINARSYAAMVDMFLQHDDLVPVVLRLLATGLSKDRQQDNLRAALKTTPRIAQRLRAIYTENPSYEVDVALVTRLWDNAVPFLNATVPFETSFEKSQCPVTCMSYFGVRDELISGHMNGSVVLWGPPQMVRDTKAGSFLPQTRAVIRPRGIVPLPLDCIPVGMAGQRMDGQYLAIASMPYKSRKPYAAFCDAPPSGAAAAGRIGRAETESGDRGETNAAQRRDGMAGAAANGGGGGGAGVGAIIVITCNENSLRWNKGEVILRPPGVALTAITAFRNSIVAVGESVVKPTSRLVSAAAVAAAAVASSAATSSQNRLSFVDVAHGTVMRQIPKAHDDYITSLNVLEEGSYVLLSGGRDAAVKLWDPRSREDTPVVNTALCTDAMAHTSTISAICPTGYNIVTSAVDGSLLVWDLRSMAAPQVRHKLDSPVVDLALLDSKYAVAATSRGLITLALDTLDPLDMRYNENGFLHVLPNSTGELVFAAETSGRLSAMAVGMSAAGV